MLEDMLLVVRQRLCGFTTMELQRTLEEVCGRERDVSRKID
jgi:hypothetical protein